MAKLLELRVGMPISPEEMHEKLAIWPEKVHGSSYIKNTVGGQKIFIGINGIEGNEAGFPSHREDATDRCVLVGNLLTYEMLKEKFPDSAFTLTGGVVV